MKYALIAAAVLAAIIVVIVVIGYSLPVKHQATVQTSFNATADSLYNLITDVKAFPSWRTGVQAVEVLPFANGHPRFRETGSDGTITYVVEYEEPGRKLVTRIDDKSLPFGGTWTYEITRGATDKPATLRITEDGEVYNPVFRFMSRFVFGHDATIRKYMKDVGNRFPAVGDKAED